MRANLGGVITKKSWIELMLFDGEIGLSAEAVAVEAFVSLLLTLAADSCLPRIGDNIGFPFIHSRNVEKGS